MLAILHQLHGGLTLLTEDVPEDDMKSYKLNLQYLTSIMFEKIHGGKKHYTNLMFIFIVSHFF